MEAQKENQRKPLGRGLAALLGEQNAVRNDSRALVEGNLSDSLHKVENNKEYFLIEIQNVEPNPEQPRRHFNQAKIEELAQSLKEHGLIQPVVVRASTKAGKYQIIAGERRWRAAQVAGLEKIPVILKEEKSFDGDLASIAENLQRENLTPIELALAYDRALKNKLLTQEKLAERLGVSRVSLANTLRLLNLPEDVRSLLNQRFLSEGHGRALLGLGEKPSAISAMAREIVERGLSVREVERKVKESFELALHGAGGGQKNQNSESTLSTRGGGQLPQAPEHANIRSLEDELRTLFANRVNIRGNTNKGRIELHYSSDEALNRLVTQLRTIK